MRPALSVIFLTTLIGAGQGLYLALITVQIYAVLGLVPPGGSQDFYSCGSLLAVLLLACGLVASFFHLGHPERAWRAAAQWRTSWLSREVIALPAFMVIVVFYGVAQWMAWKPVFFILPSGVVIDATMILGALGTVAAFALFFCTAMIYACLPFLREWHTPLTVINFVLLGGASGFTLAAGLAARLSPGLVGFLAGWALVITAIACIARVGTLIRNAHLKPRSTPQSAIGVKHTRIVQRSQGTTGGSFNTREFFHGRSRTTIAALQWVYLILVFALPLLLLGAGSRSDAMLATVFPLQFTGLLAERWLFFAQANHPQNLYYQTT